MKGITLVMRSLGSCVPIRGYLVPGSVRMANLHEKGI